MQKIRVSREISDCKRIDYEGAGKRDGEQSTWIEAIKAGSGEQEGLSPHVKDHRASC